MLNITGEQVIFKNKNNTGYYTTTSNKLEDGTFEKNFITIGFRKGVELDNFTKINIKDGFLTHYSYQNEDGETIKRFKIQKIQLAMKCLIFIQMMTCLFKR